MASFAAEIRLRELFRDELPDRPDAIWSITWRPYRVSDECRNLPSALMSNGVPHGGWCPKGEAGPAAGIARANKQELAFGECR